MKYTMREKHLLAYADENAARVARGEPRVTLADYENIQAGKAAKVEAVTDRIARRFNATDPSHSGAALNQRYGTDVFRSRYGGDPEPELLARPTATQKAATKTHNE